MANYLDQKMAGLKLSSGEGQAPPKKIGPAVPPKPKKPSQPMVPKSYAVNGPPEPSFTSPLQSTSPEKRPGGPIYSNVGYPPEESRNTESPNNTYSNAEMFNKGPSYRKAEPQAPVYSNVTVPPNSTYSNVPSYANIDEIPPMPEIPDYNDFPPPPADFPPPPSPVSSSYSELRRATLNNALPDYGTYAPSSQGSTTYDSIYEPITPRPASGMSSRSNYSLYTPSRINTRSPHEAEVDALTDLLVQSMNSPSADPDIFGDCCKCGEKVVGEGNGCTAMDNVYHIECFTCDHCAIQLQGKPFYVLEGKPYCETGYLEWGNSLRAKWKFTPTVLDSPALGLLTKNLLPLLRTHPGTTCTVLLQDEPFFCAKRLLLLLLSNLISPSILLLIFFLPSFIQFFCFEDCCDKYCHCVPARLILNHL